MTWTPGSRLGRYELLQSLGAGGMGQVFKAHNTRLDRVVAPATAVPSVDAPQADALTVIAHWNEWLKR
jgi:serine/threonine protein kinase